MAGSFWNSDEGQKRLLTLAVGGMFVFFVSVNIALSLFHGHLAMVPNYDDVGYMADALSRLRFSDGFGLQSFLKSFITDPPHAPVTTATGMFGFWLLGPEPIAAYLANSWVVLLFLLFLVRLSRPIGTALDRALFISTFLFVPVVQAMVQEFRPDLPAGLMLGIALYAVCSTDLRAATWSRKLILAVLCVAATIIKPSAFILVVPALGVALAVVLLRSIVLDRPNRRANLIAIAGIAAAYLVILAPFAIIWGAQTYDYVYGVLFTYSDVWKTAGDAHFHYFYHSTGLGGKFALGRFLRTGLILIAADLAIWIFARDRRRRGTLEYYAVVIVVYVAMAMSGEKTPYQGSLFYIPFVIAFAGASVRILAFIREVLGFGWLVRASLVAILLFDLFKLPLASYYYGAAPNAALLPPVVNRITTRLVDLSLANTGNEACSGRPINFVLTDSEPIPTQLVQLEGAKVSIPVTIGLTFMARSLDDIKKIADDADVVLIADPSHKPTSRWLPGVAFNHQLFDYLKSWGEANRFDVGSDDGTPLWLIVNPRCIPTRAAAPEAQP